MSLTDSTLELLATAGLDPGYVEDLARRALDEDLAGGLDVTSVATVPFDQEGVARFVARGAGVVAGLPVAVVVLDLASDGHVDVDLGAEDGERVGPGDVLLTATAYTRPLLLAERTALNLMCHLSGVATLTRQWADALHGTPAAVRDTRKTTPGLRALEKYAVRCGGGLNHRMSLADAALVKDNHVVSAGGVVPAFDSVRTTFPDVPIEVECDTVAQVAEAVDAGADLVLLDNMSLDDLRESVRVAAGRARLEASGGLTLSQARAVAETGIDFVAVGALTHSAPALDIGVDLELRPRLQEG
jgi:nicotinate-nucleotide pyrophosphorylase (carboxylating)